MAVFPAETPGTIESAQGSLLARWHLVAAALMIAFLCLIAGTARDSQTPRLAQPLAKNANSPHVAKREPARMPAVAERRDGGSLHPGSLDGALPALLGAFDANHSPAANLHLPASATLAGAFWPAPLPRAPPAAA